MASAFGHAAAALTITKIGGSSPIPKKVWILSILSGILPDLDAVSFKLGIPYNHALGHRGFTHSIFFALVWATLLLLFFRKAKKKLNIFLVLFFSTLSHGFLDAMTNGGLGVGFFIPFDEGRYFLPFRPIEVSPIKVSRFFDQAQRILINEFIWIGIPCLAITALASCGRLILTKRHK